MLVDSHCHLNFPQFSDCLEQIVEDARINDVKVLQTICTKLKEFSDIEKIAAQYDNIYCSVGVHPNNVAEEGVPSKEELLKLAEGKKVIGIGETGLDYYYSSEDSTKEQQQKSFITHIEVAREKGLPIIIHARDADDDIVDILKQEREKGAFPGLIHCFSSGRKLAEESLKLGLYISISGIVTFKNAEDLREIVKDVPLDRLLVETDAPYLAPVPFRGKTNQPAYTKYTAQYLAELKGVSYEELAKITTDNFYNLFTKVRK